MPDDANPCEKEPCGSARKGYLVDVETAQDAEELVLHLCYRFDFWKKFLIWPTVYLFAALFFLFLCWNDSFNAPAFLCRTLEAVVIIALLCVLVAIAIVARFARRLARARDDCRRSARAVARSRLTMHANCPPECVLPDVQIRCDC